MAKRKTKHKYTKKIRKAKPSLVSKFLRFFSLGLAVFLLTSVIPTTRTLSDTSILGDEDQVEQKKEEEKKQAEQQKEETKKIETKQKIEGKQQEFEAETADGRKIKTKIEKDGTSKLEIENGTVKLKYVLENGVLKVKAENENGDDAGLDDQDVAELEEELENELAEEGIELASDPAKPAFASNGVAAESDFPLTVDVETKQLVIEAPDGTKNLTVLPDQAVQNLLILGIVNSVKPAANQNLTNEVKLTVRDGEAVYEIPGSKEYKILGLLPWTASVTGIVSAQSGLPLATRQTLLTNILDLLSP